MKRNGFTLVEILAVLIILALLIALSIPAYINVFNSIKRDNYHAKVTEVETAANKMGEKIKDEVKNAGRGCMHTNISELINKGYLLSESDYDNVIYKPTDNTAMLGDILVCYCSTSYNVQSYYVEDFNSRKAYHKGDKVLFTNKKYMCMYDYPGNNLGINATFYDKDRKKDLSYFEEISC